MENVLYFLNGTIITKHTTLNRSMYIIHIYTHTYTYIYTHILYIHTNIHTYVFTLNTKHSIY